MKIAGLTMNNVWAHRVLAEQGVETARTEQDEAGISVLVDSLSLAHHGPETNYRPYLHLSGELSSIRPVETLPYGVREVDFPTGGGDRIDAFYEFDDLQLGQLAHKGYFSSDFAVPEQITGIEWELSTTMDTLVLAPQDQQREDGVADVPVVFVNVHDAADLVIDLESCGYDPVEYFADYSKDHTAEFGGHVDDRILRSRSDEIRPLFAEETFDEVRSPAAADSPAEGAPVPAGHDEVKARLLEVESELEAEDESRRAERERTAGTVENLYQRLVAGSLIETDEQAVGQQMPASDVNQDPADQQNDLDLADDETAGPVMAPDRRPKTQQPEDIRRAAELEETKRRVAERAAELENEDETEADHHL
ncbi:hypothetical protein [Arthrobacter castelli]|uniref:hypothetical protein n=1 Tax=Arthrobacter castelli TaxID=271431 RepID=UPI0004205569|nr:hypothetical protein [Arthrobacter castelli]